MAIRPLARLLVKNFSVILVAFTTLPTLSSAYGQADDQAASRTVQHATYTGKYESLDVTMARRLVDLGGDKFQLSTSTKNFFANIVETETFYWRNSKILPIKYQYKQKIFGIKKQRVTEFNWETSSARFSEGKKHKDIALDSETLGPMTYQLQLQIDLMNNKKTLEYAFIKRGKIKNYQFLRIAHETNDDQGMDNSILVRRTSNNGDKQTDVWFDISRGYALAAIHHTDDGDTNSMALIEEKKYPPLTNTPYEALNTSKK